MFCYRTPSGLGSLKFVPIREIRVKLPVSGLRLLPSSKAFHQPRDAIRANPMRAIARPPIAPRPGTQHRRWLHSVQPAIADKLVHHMPVNPSQRRLQRRDRLGHAQPPLHRPPGHHHLPRPGLRRHGLPQTQLKLRRSRWNARVCYHAGTIARQPDFVAITGSTITAYGISGPRKQKTRRFPGGLCHTVEFISNSYRDPSDSE